MTPVLTTEIELLPGRVTEQAVRFAAAGAPLVGNLTAPKTGTAAVGIVFVHGWSGNRSGPQNLVTTLARHFAAAGFPALRFDLRGRGESGGSGREATLATMSADLVAATEFLARQCGVRKVALVGLCSGGNVAIGTLDRLPQAAGLVLFSVYPFSDGDAFSRDVHRTWHYAKTYWHKALKGETWRRLCRGDVRLLQVVNVLFGHFLPGRKSRKKEGDLAGGPAPLATLQPAAAVQKAPQAAKVEGRKDPKSAPRQHLAKLRADLPALLVYGTADPDAKAAREYYESYAREHRLPLTFAEIADANHNFSSVAWTAEVARLATDFLGSLR